MTDENKQSKFDDFEIPENGGNILGEQAETAMITMVAMLTSFYHGVLNGGIPEDLAFQMTVELQIYIMNSGIQS